MDAFRNLIAELTNPDSCNQMRAVQELSSSGIAVIEPLLLALPGRSPEIQDLIALTLKRIGAPAIPLLQSALNHTDDEVRRVVQRVLNKLGAL